ncbi:hypothetical protein LQU92_03900 [Kocuria sp. LUK]|uniref:Uncharacterized protein n=1 Tax=Kocuria flava TaxID=446860 RepID=A0A2N4SZY2_9MICC|nr:MULTISPECIES: hypothetical protein [Kocuria]MCD1144386.1 hypothetical protein [Kocuria sp. LUK]PLC11534.1 hypothetical protein AUQ48_03825 [Kocuria flava]
MSIRKSRSEKQAAAAQKAAESKVLDAGKWASKEIGDLAPKLQHGIEAGAAALAGGVAAAGPRVQEGLGRAHDLSDSAKLKAAAVATPVAAKAARSAAPVAAKAADRAAESRAAVQAKYAGAAALLAGKFAEADTPEQLEAIVARLTGDKKAVAHAKKAAAKVAKDYAKQQKKAEGSHKGLLVLGLLVAGGVAGVAAWKASRPVEDPWKTPAATSPRVSASPVAPQTTVAAGTGVQVDDVKDATTPAGQSGGTSAAAAEAKEGAQSIGEDAKTTIHEVKEQIQGKKPEDEA